MYDSIAPHSHAAGEDSLPREAPTLFDVSVAGLNEPPDSSGSATGEDATDATDVTESSVCRDAGEDREWEEPDSIEDATAPDEDALTILDSTEDAMAPDEDAADPDEDAAPIPEGPAGRDDVSAHSEESSSTLEAPRGVEVDPPDSPTPSGKPMPELPVRGAIAQLGVRRPGVAPKRIGRGRLVPARLTWKPGDPFAASAGRRREPFRWEVMLTAASVTAACGLGCIWLLRTILA